MASDIRRHGFDPFRRRRRPAHAAGEASSPALAPPTPQMRAGVPQTPPWAGDLVPDQYVVVFKNEFAGEVAAAAHALTAAHGGTLLHTYRHALRGFSARLSTAAAAALRNNPRVAYVEQDRVISVSRTRIQRNTPSWGLDRIDQRDLPLSGSPRGHVRLRRGGQPDLVPRPGEGV